MVELTKTLPKVSLVRIDDMNLNLRENPVFLQHVAGGEIRALYDTQGAYVTLGVNSGFRGGGSQSAQSILKTYGDGWKIFQFQSWIEANAWLAQNL